MDEQNLSQKMSQLSTHRTRNGRQTWLKDMKNQIEKTPNYLTRRNESCKQMISQVLSTLRSPTAHSDSKDATEKLREIAILLHKIMVIRTYHSLWTIYLRAGMGQLILPFTTKVKYSTTLPIWPKAITAIVESIKNENCSSFVKRHLQEFDRQLAKYLFELNLKINRFPNYTLTIPNRIETYIEQNLRCLRLEIEHKIELVHYDYHIRALKLEYFRYQPNEYQQRLMRELCQQKYEQETIEQDYHLLQRQMAHYNSPHQFFQSSPLAHSSLVESIEDSSFRQQLLQYDRKVAEQSRAQLFNLRLAKTREERIQCRNRYHASVAKMWLDRRTSIASEQIRTILVDLIDERCNKISERIQCIYKFKVQSIGSDTQSYSLN